MSYAARPILTAQAGLLLYARPFQSLLRLAQDGYCAIHNHDGLRQSAEAHAVSTADHNMPKRASMQCIQPVSAIDRLEESQGLPKFQSLNLNQH